MSKHTPGPWVATGWEEIVVNAPNGNTLCLAPSDSKDCTLETIKANARLIAAAPELLTEAKNLLAWWNSLPLDSKPSIPNHEAILAVIASVRTIVRKIDKA